MSAHVPAAKRETIYDTLISVSSIFAFYALANSPKYFIVLPCECNHGNFTLPCCLLKDVSFIPFGCVCVKWIVFLMLEIILLQ